MGGHWLGMRLLPVFTTKDTAVPGLNRRVSLDPTAVTQTNHSPAASCDSVTLCNTEANVSLSNNQESAVLVSAFTLLLSCNHRLESALRIVCASFACQNYSQCSVQMFEIILSYAFCSVYQHVLVVCSAAMDHECLRGRILC